MIDTMEVQDLATADITGHFLQTDIDKGDMHINMKEEIMTLLEEINPAYYKYFIHIYSHIKKFMYEESHKAIYYTLEASLIF